MPRLLPLLLLPIAELWLLLELGGNLGAWPVMLWCIAMVLLGMWLVRRQAEAMGDFLRRAQADGRRGIRTAAFEVGWHGLWAFAGLFFAFPGVISDVLAVGLIIAGLVKKRRRRSPEPIASTTPNASADVEVLPPGQVASPFEKRPRIIDVD